MIKWLEDHWFYLTAFIMTIFVMLVVYATFYIYPLGDGSVLVLDLNGQYVSYFEQFRATFYEGKSLLYSWSSSLGGEFLGTTAYYLLSPFSFITLLFPRNHITEAILVMSVCKLATASLTMTYYLHKKGVSDIHSLLLGMCYGLSAYAVVQVMNIMWIDAVIMLPIFILSIENLINEKKYGLFVFALCFLFITNYYIAYMIGLFGGLYFFYYEIKQQNTGKEFLKDFLFFIGYTLICILLCSWILLPTIYSLSLGKSTFTTPDYSLFVKFDLLDFVVKMLPSTYDSVNVQGLPFIYCGVLPLILVPLYFLNKEIKMHDKVCDLVLLVIVMLCMNISWLDLALHGFQNPNWLNYRYAFVYPFLMLRLAGKAIRNKDGINGQMVLGVFLSLFVLIMLIQKYGFYYLDDLFSVILGLLFIGVYCLMLLKSPNAIVNMVLIMFMCLELGTNAYTSLHDLDAEVLYSTRESYIPFMEEIKTAYNSIKAEDPTGIYRVEKTYHRTVNDPMSIGYAGISHSTSSLNKESINVLNRLGYAAREHWTKYLGGTPLSDSILGIKYVMSKGSFVPYYTYLYNCEELTIYQNNTALGIINSVSSDLKFVEMEQDSPLVLQNEVLSKMLGIRYTEFFKPFEVASIELENVKESEIAGHTRYSVINRDENSEVFFNFKDSKGDRVFFYFASSYPREVNMWFNENWIDTFFGNETTRVFDLGYVDYGDKLGLTIVNTDLYLKNDVAYFYTFDEELFKEKIKELQGKSATITSFKETQLVAEIDVELNDIVMTSIPYEKGWSIYVDGKKVEYYEVMDAFIAFDVEAGHHTIEMKFSPYGFRLGWILALLGIILLFVINPKWRQLFLKQKQV